MRREPGMLLRYPFNCHLDRAGPPHSCPLRGGNGTTVASSGSDCSAEFMAEGFDLVLGLGNALGIAQLFGFFELFAEFFKLTAVRSFCLGIKHFTRVFRRAGA